MGCDYYIVKVLHIYYNETDYLVLELYRNNRYYYYDTDEDEDEDEDEEGYEEKVSEYKRGCLTPRMEPILLYDNGEFINPSFEITYKTIIEDKINKYHMNWYNVNKILKVEERYER